MKENSARGGGTRKTKEPGVGRYSLAKKKKGMGARVQQKKGKKDRGRDLLVWRRTTRELEVPVVPDGVLSGNSGSWRTNRKKMKRDVNGLKGGVR